MVAAVVAVVVVVAFYVSICFSASLITKLFCEKSSGFEPDNVKNKASLRDFLNFLNLITSKTKQFCETSSIFQVGNIKNEAILGDCLQ